MARDNKPHKRSNRNSSRSSKPLLAPTTTNNNQKKKTHKKQKGPLHLNKSLANIPKHEKPTKIAEPPKLLAPAEQRKFFLDQFEAANSLKLSSLELQSIQDAYFVELSEGTSQDASDLGKHVKDAFGSKWKDVLCEPQLVEGKIDAGNPAVLVVSASAIRALEMLRGLRSFTKECQAVKLFSKHMKVDEQVVMLKKRVNVASGTPSRIKKLFELEALGLSRLEVVILDMHCDVKGYSLFTLPQVRDEFWDLYKSYFHQRLLQGNLRVCLYGPVSTTTGRRIKKSEDE